MPRSPHKNMKSSDIADCRRGSAGGRVVGSHVSMPSQYKPRVSSRSARSTISYLVVPVKSSTTKEQPKPQSDIQVPLVTITKSPSRVCGRRVAMTQPARARQHRSKVLLRHSLVPDIPKRQSKFKPARSSVVLWSMAVAIFLIGTVVSILSLSTNRHARAQVAQLTQTKNTGTDVSTDIPSEMPPSGKLSDYLVAPTLPRFLSIPKLNVKTRVVRVDVKSNNELQVPNNIFDAGWYDGSSKPGESGAMLVAAHVRGPTQPGVFADLKTLAAGDGLEVERGDGVRSHFKVVKSHNYPANSLDMIAALRSIQPGTNGLNLITCSGKLDSTKTHYEDRLVVFTVQIN